METAVRRCELCGGDAAVCCPSDSAFLCWTCDAKVHQANFLVARHIRDVICWECKSYTGNRVSGSGGVVPSAGLCPSCASPPGDAVSSSSSSSSSSACVSSTHSSGGKGRRRENCGWSESSAMKGGARSPVTDPAAEYVFGNWCRGLGITGEKGKVVILKACEALPFCKAVRTVLPFRAVLAACLLFGLRRCEDHSPSSTWRAARKLEEISGGVPARLILAAETKIQRVAEKAGRQRRRHWMAEGWDECSAS